MAPLVRQSDKRPLIVPIHIREPPFRWLPVRPAHGLTSVNANLVRTAGVSRMFQALLVPTGILRSLLSPVSRLGSELGLL